MPSEKPPESDVESYGDSISEHASDWIRQLIKHLELNFVETSRSLPPDASMADYQGAAVQAMVQTMLDSGMETESFAELFGQVLIERRSGSVEWSAELNKRRFELIDKDIQDTITPVEEIELAGLTRVMRGQLDSEMNLPGDEKGTQLFVAVAQVNRWMFLICRCVILHPLSLTSRRPPASTGTNWPPFLSVLLLRRRVLRQGFPIRLDHDA